MNNTSRIGKLTNEFIVESLKVMANDCAHVGSVSTLGAIDSLNDINSLLQLLCDAANVASESVENESEESAVASGRLIVFATRLQHAMNALK